MFEGTNLASADPITCSPNSIEPQLLSDDLVTIQCSGGSIAWAGILRTATLTNTTKDVRNFRKVGGNNGALSDFNKMPGNPVNRPEGVKTKTHEGKTVTYYPVSKSTAEPTLQYPAISGTQTWDKVRFTP